MAPRPEVGELRPSQLLYVFGIGAIVDLPNLSTMVMGLEEWDGARARPLREDRLLEAVKGQLGEQVERLVLPPMEEDALKAALEPGQVGVPVSSFPSFMRCPLCNHLGPRRRGIFDLKMDLMRPDRTRYVHSNCQKAQYGKPAVLPARFLVACERGHLDEFPWVSFVHGGKKDCHGQLVLSERGLSGDATDLVVRCQACDSKRALAEAFSEEGMKAYSCRGRRPHLRDFEEECTAELRAILLGASNSWFPVTLSVLYVPPSLEDELARYVEERWSTLSDVSDRAVLGFLRKQGQLGPLAAYGDEQVWRAIEARRNEAGTGDAGDLKAPEWRVLTRPESAPSASDFRLREVERPAAFRKLIRKVVLAERLREVTALTGFTRVGAPMDFEDAYAPKSEHRMPLSRQPPTFVPAAEVRGEGIFLELEEEELAAWCERQGDREKRFLAAHEGWRRQRGIEPASAGFPGIRYVLLHSFSHALMRQFAIECGYTAASIRERLYSRGPEEEGGPMAGLLLYTAAADSEGTLGGLVRLGRPEHLERLIVQALEDVRLCASDPLCSEHLPGGDSGPRTLHGAACHSCAFAPETSCERGNKFLDRGVLVDTVSGSPLAFFEGWLTRQGSPTS
ncbi:DrmB family protein [Archangium violaceum]|uniref:DrmB family protein n=1 Tax=Archangium violaceum TaxID=83451 RepID=UPI0036D96A30